MKLQDEFLRAHSGKLIYFSTKMITDHSGVGRCFSMGGLQFFKDTELNFQHKTPFGKD